MVFPMSDFFTMKKHRVQDTQLSFVVYELRRNAECHSYSHSCMYASMQFKLYIIDDDDTKNMGT